MGAIQFKCTYNCYRKLTVWHSASSFWRWDRANRKFMEYVRLLLAKTLLFTKLPCERKNNWVGKCIMHFQVIILCQSGQSWINDLWGSKIAFGFWPSIRSVVQCGRGFCMVPMSHVSVHNQVISLYSIVKRRWRSALCSRLESIKNSPLFWTAMSIGWFIPGHSGIHLGC